MRQPLVLLQFFFARNQRVFDVNLQYSTACPPVVCSTASCVHAKVQLRTH